MADEANETPQTMSDIAEGIETPSVQDPQAKPVVSDSKGDAKDFEAFAKTQREQTEALSEKLDSTSKNLDELVNSQRQDKVNKDISSAAGKINENVGGDADIAALWLEQQYNTNPEFKKIWENREANPQAFDKALELLGPEWAAKNQNAIDPQIAENQRALMESQKAGGTVQMTSEEDKLAELPNRDFLETIRRTNQD